MIEFRNQGIIGKVNFTLIACILSAALLNSPVGVCF